MEQVTLKLVFKPITIRNLTIIRGHFGTDMRRPVVKNKKEDKIVKFSSELNRNILLANLSGKEIDIFNAICIKLRNEGSRVIKISFGELKALSNYTHRSKERFFGDVSNVCANILTIRVKAQIDENRVIGTTVFSKYDLNSDNEELYIKLNDDFLHLFNNLNNNLTVFNIEESYNLNSKYSKIQYKNLKEDSNKGEYVENYGEFKEKMNATNMKPIDITRRILKPIENELGKVFDGFQLIKEKNGREINKLVWTWKESNDNLFEFFNDIFKFMNVNFTHKIQCKLAEMQKEMDKEDIKNLIMEAWDIIKNSPKIKNPPAMLSKAITDVALETFIKNSKEMEHKIKSKNESVKREQECNKKKEEDNVEFIRDSDSYNKFQELPEEEKDRIYSEAQKLFKEKTGHEIFGPRGNIITLMGLMQFIRPLMEQNKKEEMI